VPPLARTAARARTCTRIAWVCVGKWLHAACAYMVTRTWVEYGVWSAVAHLLTHARTWLQQTSTCLCAVSVHQYVFCGSERGGEGGREGGRERGRAREGGMGGGGGGGERPGSMEDTEKGGQGAHTRPSPNVLTCREDTHTERIQKGSWLASYTSHFHGTYGRELANLTTCPDILF
jgi:hypothetical protein